jgi:O-antigen/teichoic acid export membrane protein
VLGLSILIAIAGVVLVWSLADMINREQAIVFSIAFASLPLFSLCRLRESSLRALKKVVQSELLMMVIRPLLLGLLVIFLFLATQRYPKALHAMGCNFMSLVMIFVIGTLLLYRELPKAVFQTQPEYSYKEWLKVSLPLLLIAGMHIILKRTDIVMLGLLRSARDAGVYSAATRVSNLLVFGLMAVNTMLGPMTSEFFHTDRNNELQKIVRFAARGIFSFTLIVGILLVLLGKYILSLFGEPFVVAYIPLLILLVGQMVNSLAGPVALIMTMTGHQNQTGIIFAVTSILNVVLNALLIPIMGILGAAIATASVMVFRNTILLIYVQKKIGLNPTVFKLLSIRKAGKDEANTTS